MLDKILLEFDDAFPDGCIVGNHGLTKDEIEKLTAETEKYISTLKNHLKPTKNNTSA